tara:strand:+ start:2189 stop:3082 length:894 start_codon:yes stop_codon:yes gene_type:complete
MAKSAKETYEEITNTILAHMEEAQEKGTQFTLPFAQAGGLAVNAETKKTYQGINQLILGLHGQRYYGTYRTWQRLDAQVRKGEKGIVITKFDMIKEKNPEDPANPQYFPLLKRHVVFGADQVDGWDAPAQETDSVATEQEVNENVESWVADTKADICHSPSARAYYQPSLDAIHMPNRELFRGTATSSATETYYSTLLHELTHWTGSAKRLNRLKDSRFGDKDYALEELVAELGAAYLCAGLGVSVAVREDHAHYLNSWIKALKNDKKAIFKAASAAQKAVNWLNDAVDNERKEEAA